MKGKGKSWTELYNRNGRGKTKWTWKCRSVLSNLPLVASSFLRVDQRTGKFRKKIGVSQKESNRARA